MTKKKPIVVIFHRLGPYHHARLRAAAQLGSLTAIEIVRKDATYGWDVVDEVTNFERITLFTERDGSRVGAAELRRRLFGALEKASPRVVLVPGWSAPYALAAVQWCLVKATPAVLMDDSTSEDRPRWRVIEAIKSTIIQTFAAALVAGTRQINYLRSLGFAGCIFSGYDVVDNEFFAGPWGGGRVDSPAAAEKRTFLACCRFITVKNLPRLLDAYSRYRMLAGENAWDLLLAGDGPEKTSLLRRINSLKLNHSVSLEGFIQYQRLPPVYRQAGALVLPSISESWGLVVNEAMAAGLPVLVSNRCGCVPDLVEEGHNGFTFDPYDTERLAQLMVKISSMPDGLREQMGRASQEIISHWTPGNFAENLWKAVERASTGPRPEPSFLACTLVRLLMHRPRNS